MVKITIKRLKWGWGDTILYDIQTCPYSVLAEISHNIPAAPAQSCVVFFHWCELSNNHTKAGEKIFKILFLYRCKEFTLGTNISKQAHFISQQIDTLHLQF